LLTSDLVPRGSEQIFISTGRDFPDALSAAPIAAHAASPILLIDGKSSALSVDEMRVIATQLSPVFGVPRIVGGTSAVSAAIEDQLRMMYKQTYRYDGRDRFEVSMALNQGRVFEAPVYVASGASFPDALAGGAAAGAQGRPIYLARNHCLPKAAVDYFVLERAKSVTLLGGPAALGVEVELLTPCL
jgi:putative cell wall-binding protein